MPGVAATGQLVGEAQFGGVLLSGILMMDRGIDLGGFTLPAMLSDDFWLSLWFDVHVFSCALLAGLVLLHVVAVIKHELLGRRILQRMWF